MSSSDCVSVPFGRDRARPFASARFMTLKTLGDMRAWGELPDQASTSSKADRASPRTIIDQSPASRPKSRTTVIATEAVSVATLDFLKAPGAVFCSPIVLRPRFLTRASSKGREAISSPKCVGDLKFVDCCNQATIHNVDSRQEASRPPTMAACRATLADMDWQQIIPVVVVAALGAFVLSALYSGRAN